MCRKESWGAITVPKEAHSTQRGQPPRYRQMQGIFLFIKRFLKHQNFLSDSSNSYLMWTFVTRLPQQAIQRHSLCDRLAKRNIFKHQRYAGWFHPTVDCRRKVIP